MTDPRRSPHTHRRRFPGTFEQVSAARRFIAAHLNGCPRLDDVLLMIGEIAANAVEHTDTGNNGSFEVTLLHDATGWLRIEVRDDGSPVRPQICPLGHVEDRESGYGLQIVDTLSDNWGHKDELRGHFVFFEVAWDSET
ncbi:ATP-binding protein [Actinomadura craniellae]|uniref:ATP-binding protein n=1 Tax=Actinomadura craniellae TaxID=2231787 RepID=A0A365GVB8_9ACTN|nr:ATP-binding protein [Actinomadura craniellae]RAY10746.1 ATP-binding protein [Actinomadura craniellae]